ncbi:EscU/YscU/HrcU family type III secretion system export apparatus switch protein [Acetobacter oeni]|uniref:Flagellar biosynthesis protein FlhB n=1 Tax=Acetobacter oeni TaxID=304077 RepID=A0A511XJD1_9PROT|nr:flagellar type III secretion system protein FlhB [Acetobacter oeni]MBB3882760.1 flagellar biosynthetic protein FlhB [Acetobacter oeni]NHO18853.1 flagellar type III secretion system protein FlhB [Acetobacter oeni]GBR06446.1 flagellar biosynthetic protein FlhB [Acetobacter oeni LMG 21952]GEN63052.1 flagellar biosynthesis protein FlhB [Acetobacter oeni]
MADSDTGDTTEAPTGRRLERAREEGNIAQSRELHLFSSLGLASIVLVMVLPEGAGRFVKEMKGLLEHSGDIDFDPSSASQVMLFCAKTAMFLGLPMAGAAAIAGVTTSVLQSGFLMRPEALIPDITRLNPLKGIKRIFSVSSLIDTIKSVAKMGAFSFLLYGVVRDSLAMAPNAMSWSPEIFTGVLYSLTMHMLVAVLVVQAAIVVLDEVWTRYHRLQGLKMSRHDIKEETKQSEGDPHVKGRQKQLRMRASRKRIREAVRKSTVVITNPTHYAVALEYEQGNKAPRVVAKGMDELAARIREFAHEAKIPIVSNPPLARSLYTLPEDSEIPYEYFQAVAAVIAYVWKLKRRPSSASPPVR